MSKQTLIKIKDITKTYGTKVKTAVLKDINLEIEKGSFNWIVGASGSGKTTLLNIISGLDASTSGKVEIEGVDLVSLTPNERARFRANNLGFIFQFHYLLPEYNALDNILMPLRIQNKKIDKAVKQRALDLMKEVGIDHVHDHYPNQMSGGEQQRTAVARAIIGGPLLILADEPTGNLDSSSAEAVYQLLRALHQTYKTTFIVITHDKINPAKGDRLLTLKDGVLIKDVIY
ncbi:MAG: ABC transporter ATP-binding protein [Acholeplasmataceae bacterium]